MSVSVWVVPREALPRVLATTPDITKMRVATLMPLTQAATQQKNDMSNDYLVYMLKSMAGC